MADRPLEGLRVVVTRPRGQAAGLARPLRDAGAEVVEVPVIRIVPEPLPQAAAGGHDWVAFTSANAVRAVAELRPSGRIACVGPATAAAAREAGFEVSLIPDVHTAAALAEALGAGEGRSVLLPQSEIASPDLSQSLKAAGWDVTAVVAYRTVPDDEAVAPDEFDVLCFASGSAVRAWMRLMGRPHEPVLVCCIGPSTAAAAEAAGLRADVVADEHTSEGLVEALARHVGRPSR